MTHYILRPGDKGFAEAFRYAPSYVEEYTITQKIQKLFNAEGVGTEYIVVASTKGRVAALPSSDFENYYTYNYLSRRYEKNVYAVVPSETVNSNWPKYSVEGPTRKPNVPIMYGETISGRIDSSGKFKVEYPIKEENEMIDNKLYVVLDGEHKGKYVNKVAVNAAGHFVVEAKGEAAYFAVAKESLERVLPYSVDVKFYSNGSLGDKMYSYWAKEGDVEVGDVIFGEYSNAMRVVAVNTKSDTANKWLIGSVIKPAKVLTGE